MKVAERIQNLGGTPVDDEGLVGSVQGFLGQFKIPDTTEEIIKSALEGEDYYGINISEAIISSNSSEILLGCPSPRTVEIFQSSGYFWINQNISFSCFGHSCFIFNIHLLLHNFSSLFIPMSFFMNNTSNLPK